MERSAEDTGLVITTYEGTHTHVSPATNSRTSTSDAPSLPASGEHRPGGAAYQPPASSFGPFTSANSVPPPTSHSNYDLTVQIQSGAQRDQLHASSAGPATSTLSSQLAQDIQMHGGSGSGCNGVLQTLNNVLQEPASLPRGGHGSLQELFTPCIQDLSFLRAQQLLLGAQSSDSQTLTRVENLRDEDFGAQCIQGEDDDDNILRALQIPFWTQTSSINNSEPLSTTITRGMVLAGTDDECVRDQSPINEGLLGDVVRLGVRW